MEKRHRKEHFCRFGLVILVAIGVFISGGTAGHAASSLQVLATVGGQPDDVTVDTHGHLVWGNLAHGTIERLIGARIVTVARGLSVPEGLVALPNGTIVVAEQGLDRITRVAKGGGTTVIYSLQPVPGQEGVDSIGRDPKTGELLVPDSPRGTVLRVSANGRQSRLIAQGLGRPVDAALDSQGNVLVPDEHLGSLVVISPNGKISYRGSFNTPDDVRVDQKGHIWVTSLGDGGLWELASHAAPRRILAGLANPQGLTLDRCGDPIVVEQNTGQIVRVLLTASSHSCAL
jgi:streptogramin lyase